MRTRWRVEAAPALEPTSCNREELVEGTQQRRSDWLAVVASYRRGRRPARRADCNHAAMDAGRPYAGVSAEDRAAERRRRLLDAGLELFGRPDHTSASVQAICAEAGVTRRAFYEEFADREALLLAVHDEVVGALVAEVLAVLPGSPDVPAGIERAVRRAFEHLAEDERRAHVQFVAVVGVSPALEDHRRSTTRALSEQLAALLEPALPDLAPLARRRVALALLGAVDELIMDWLWRPEGELTDLTEEAAIIVRTRLRGN